MTKVFDARSNRNLQVDFEGGKPENPEKNPQSTGGNISHQAQWGLNPGCIGERRVL